MLQVIKRDGTKVPFDKNKIALAIGGLCGSIQILGLLCSIPVKYDIGILMESALP